MKTNPVEWFEIYVQDMSRANMFYETMLQTKLVRLTSPGMEMWGFLTKAEQWVRVVPWSK
jgi:predicted enzyme related to lactoylglutathione lyase